MINSITISECTEDVCINAAKTISKTINWTQDACNDFKSFCCSDTLETFGAFKSSQEIVDQNILRKLKSFFLLLRLDLLLIILVFFRIIDT